MLNWVECVPNFSEGRDQRVIRTIEAAIVGTPHVHLLDVHSDTSHNRSVFTFVGPPDGARRAALNAARVAIELVDLTRHEGEHPRMGAVDVVPFVPLMDTPMEVCVAAARELGAHLGEELGIPTFLYGYAATRPNLTGLPVIRRGGFEGIRARMEAGSAPNPDFGPSAIHPTAGATAVGARDVLVAFNVYLNADDKAAAGEIAKLIRESNGGLIAVRAIGLSVGGRAQVSMNLTDIDVTTPLDVLRAVEAAAQKLGLRVVESEFVGLVPARAVTGTDAKQLRHPTALSGRLLEPKVSRLRE